MLRGRDDERAVLDRLLQEARAGQSGVLVLRGEAGTGKTALLQHTIESASDLIVVEAVGVESDMELAYAALHQLCAPLLDRVDRILVDARHQNATTSFACGSLPRRKPCFPHEPSSSSKYASAPPRRSRGGTSRFPPSPLQVVAIKTPPRRPR